MGKHNRRKIREMEVLSNTERKAKLSVYISAYITMLIAFFWGLYFLAPTPIKIIFSIGMWTSIACFPFVLIRNNDLDNHANLLLKLLLVFAVVQILRSAFSIDVSLYAFGNKWLTLFGNEYTALLLMPPLFTYLGTLENGAFILKKITWVYLVLGAICSVTLNMPLAFLSIYAFVFYPYVKGTYKILILVAIAEAIIKLSATRMFLIVLFFTFASFFLVYIVKRSVIIKSFVFCVVVAPIFLFIPLLSTNGGGESFFQEAQSYVTDETNDDELASDTRTFLYLEMAEDLTNSHSWLIGKGAFSHYYSLFFDQDSNGRYGRISSEVPFLNYLLRGGIVYIVLYFGLILFAVYKAIWKGRNKFVQSIGIIAIGWYFNSFVGDITGCRFYHVAFFLLLGCCLSERWLNYTDEEIKRNLCRK